MQFDSKIIIKKLLNFIKCNNYFYKHTVSLPILNTTFLASSSNAMCSVNLFTFISSSQWYVMKNTNYISHHAIFPHSLLLPLPWIQIFPSLPCSHIPTINYVMSLCVTDNVSYPSKTTDKIGWVVMVKAYKHNWYLNKLWADFSFLLYSYCMSTFFPLFWNMSYFLFWLPL